MLVGGALEEVAAEERDRVNSLRDFAADALLDKDFVVADRQHCDQLLRAAGFEVSNKPARLRCPVLKVAMLQKAMRWVASVERPWLSVVRSRLGIWLPGALLRQEPLSTPPILRNSSWSAAVVALRSP